ncbi:hypothetical protein JQ615_29760 [Bradyrhizobium jicamae]|uniref:Uncharacterized protein n=1 Tax=Bradyrhizobium jicamae TaxID=280332 RepID=A0ABS5FRW6_9BRAD|nr:hypothetical protein [Bradyrhizobium jicamae]MBR0799566.1 hypothetical protein [Bradyrhizobium jicamae]
MMKVAVRSLIVMGLLSLVFEARAEDNSQTCSDTFSLLNDNAKLEAFDKQEGGKDKRLEFRQHGAEPCSKNVCRLDVVRRPSRSVGGGRPFELAKGDRVIASVNLSHRNPSYCVHVGRVEVVQPVDPSEPARHQRLRALCPESYLHNSMVIKFTDDSRGPYSTRRIEIEYKYRPDGSDVDLDWCETPSFDYGDYRRDAWTVPFGDGAVAVIAETDSPRQGVGTRNLNLDPLRPSPADKAFFESPYAVTVFGARERVTR